MRHPTSIVVAAAILGAAGCVQGGDVGVELAGTWRVTAHSYNETGCEPGTPLTDPPYIRFSEESVAGKTYFQYVDCSDATTCDAGNPLLDLQYARDLGNGMEAVQYRADGDLKLCQLSKTTSQAIVDFDGRLTITTGRVAETVTNTPCTVAEAETRYQSTWVCVTSESLTAVRE